MLTDEQIFDILDGCADAQVLQQHVHLIEHSLNYQQYFKELKAMHIDLANMPLEQPSANFAENVLAAIPAEKPVVIIVRKRVWSAKLTYIFFGTMIALLLIATSIAVFYRPSFETHEGQPNLILTGLSNFLSQHFTNLAVLLNLIVLLVVFDKKVLKPFFKHRKITLG